MKTGNLGMGKVNPLLSDVLVNAWNVMPLSESVNELLLACERTEVAKGRDVRAKRVRSFISRVGSKDESSPALRRNERSASSARFRV